MFTNVLLFFFFLVIYYATHDVIISLIVNVCICAGGGSAGRGDPARAVEASVSCGVSTPRQAQDRAGALHDGVVHVRLFPNSTLGLGPPSVGHVPV